MNRRFCNQLRTTLLPVLFLLLGITMRGQLGFCTGSKGNPIFFENFGSGTTFGPALPAGTTSYTFTAGVPNDGQYTLHYMNGFNGSWHNAPDHTPDNEPNGLNGKSLIVNASVVAGEFYKRTVNGLCVNTNFEFSAYVMNVYDAADQVCSGTGIPVDVTFEIWDVTETTLLRSGSTNAISGTTTPIWTQYALTFTTLPGQTAVVLKMKNNGTGGCGNDLAIDDITFRSCGDPAAIASTAVTGNRYDVCDDGLPFNLPLNVVISNTTPHAFQWQQSNDNSNFTDIVGANGNSYMVTNLNATKYFRVKIAQDAANLANPFCYTISDVFTVSVTPKPNAPVSSGNMLACSGTAIPPLSVTVPSGINVDWFDAATGGTLIQANATSYQPTVPGTYFAEAYLPTLNCRSAMRTAMTLTLSQSPSVVDETLLLCENETITLDAGIPLLGYVWSTGETTQSIVVAAAGSYTVIVTGAGGCTATKTIVVTQTIDPQILDIVVDDDTITIVTLIDAASAVEYSIDGINFQNSNTFIGVPGGYLTAYIRSYNGCGSDSMQDFVLSVPEFFTPNGDGYNDLFEIPELALLPNSQIKIFDRFGKLLKTLSGLNAVWDGIYIDRLVPASDYWYLITLGNGLERKGHFTLKR